MAERNGSLLDMAVDFIIENIVHIIGFFLGVSAKWATRYKNKSDDMRAYIYDGVIAAAATFLIWQTLKYLDRTDLAPIAIFISARYGDAMISLIWIKIKQMISAKKPEEL